MHEILLQLIKLVSTHSRPKAAGFQPVHKQAVSFGFNTQPPEGGWIIHLRYLWLNKKFQHTAARRRLGRPFNFGGLLLTVSTHSRPKAAGRHEKVIFETLQRFNTQPPEGGWAARSLLYQSAMSFQHTAARRRLALINSTARVPVLFQHTAARRRLAALKFRQVWAWLFQHTAARRRLGLQLVRAEAAVEVSTHSRPKAAGAPFISIKYSSTFQHTAARRRLGPGLLQQARGNVVSTHSRPKAAGRGFHHDLRAAAFQHTAARRRLGSGKFSAMLD